MALDFVGGCFGGFAGILVGHPFDTVKVRLQTQDGFNPRYKGTINCFTQIFKTEKVFGFYKGMAAPLGGQVFINAIIFGVHGNALRRINDQGFTGFGGQFLAGSVAGGVQAIVCSPMELIKSRLQIQGQGESRTVMRSHLKTTSDRFAYKNPIDVIGKIYRYEGIVGLYRGMACTMLRELPAFGIYFSSYYYSCNFLNANEGSLSLLNIGKLLLCGGTAGTLSWILTYPIDVVKTRLQIDGMGKNVYSGIFNCFVKSYKDEGFRVMFKGLNATLIRAFPTNAATFATVTIFMRLAEDGGFPINE